MKRGSLAILAVIVLGGSASAHHSHPAFLLDKNVSIEGDLIELKFGNPHILMKVRVADGTVYLAEWQGQTWFYNRERDDHRTNKRYDKRPFTDVTSATLKVGDHLVITGCPSRDPAVHELVVLNEVRRPRDGWVCRG